MPLNLIVQVFMNTGITLKEYCAGGEIRTLMPLRALRPEHSVSTNSTTSA